MVKCVSMISLLLAAFVVFAGDLVTENLKDFAVADNDPWCGENGSRPMKETVCRWDSNVRAQGNCQIEEEIGRRATYASCKSVRFRWMPRDELSQFTGNQRVVALLLYGLQKGRALELPEPILGSTPEFTPRCWRSFGDPNSFPPQKAYWQSWVACLREADAVLANNYLKNAQVKKVVDVMRSLDRFDFEAPENRAKVDALTKLAESTRDSDFTVGGSVTLDQLATILSGSKQKP